MKDKIQKSLKGILSNLYNSPEININQYAVNIQDNKDKEHGDLASNIALILAKPLKRNPLDIANEIIQQFNLDEDILKVEVAGPGFINFFLSKNSHGEVLKNIDSEKEETLLRFLEDTCELEVHSGYVIKWFAVRIDPD